MIGTQALLTESVRFNQLAVVVVDEQHRFGVLQRAAFRTKGGSAVAAPTGTSLDAEHMPGASPSPPAKTAGNFKMVAPPIEARQASPHYLVMTATPIPRSLSLTVFGDLDISTIDALPPGRTPITTRVVGPEKADDVYRYMAKRVSGGEQAYVVVPTIDPTGQESSKELKNVQSHARLLQEKFCPGLRVAAMHGRLKRETREAIMHRFRAGQIHVLVATTVIEVGVDVPNASMMIVEHAERFGLAQLHQLRGRIGRGTAGTKAVCVFIAEPGNEDAAGRIKAIAATTDGFKIAEADLEIRGMGEFFGTRQSGQASLRVARIPQDMELLQLARHDAQNLLESDPTLMSPTRLRLRKLLIQQHGEALGLIDVG